MCGVHDNSMKVDFRFLCGKKARAVLHLSYTGCHYDVLPVRSGLRGGVSGVKCDSAVVSGGRCAVVSAGMEELLAEYRSDERVAFAHCISRNIGDKKHMSQGVATVFSRLVGKPTKDDVEVPDVLTHQRYGRAHVYGLMTKNMHWDKPKPEDYERAFRSLSFSLRRENVKLLVVPPAGCVRDRVPVPAFARFLKKLSDHCGVRVMVSVYADKGVNVNFLRKKLCDNIKAVFEVPKVQTLSVPPVKVPKVVSVPDVPKSGADFVFPDVTVPPPSLPFVPIDCDTGSGREKEAEYSESSVVDSCEYFWDEEFVGDPQLFVDDCDSDVELDNHVLEALTGVEFSDVGVQCVADVEEVGVQVDCGLGTAEDTECDSHGVSVDCDVVNDVKNSGKACWWKC
jgi:hypothetical protein